MTTRRGTLWGLLALFITACGGEPDAARIHVTVRLVEDDGSPVVDGALSGETVREHTNGAGEVSLVLKGPEVLVATGDEVLAEPLILGAKDHEQTVEVKLWRRNGGTRHALHFGGDVMFARRYLEPTSGEPWLVEGELESGAATVVAPIASAFSAADYSVVNLETVVSDLSPEAAYPGKRFLLNSPVGALAGLSKLGVDLVTLANNHTRDWLEPGLEQTLSALDEVGIPHVGAGLNAASALLPQQVSLDGLTVTTLGFTSVNGSFVNDNYPVDAAEVPAELADEDAWLWESRPFELLTEGFNVAAGNYRMGELWQRYSESEADWSEEQRALVWAALVEVYPELQDWVARRGHGGAANYVAATAKTQIAEAKAQSDLVIVQLHAGYQFQNVASETFVKMAHAAVDAGADLVIGHHPHVLQGVEFYGGKLIVHSLGNFVFDQDFLSTFSSAFLRTVWQGTELLEARFIPVEIAGYRPHAAADRAADRVFAKIWEASVMPARSERVAGGVYPVSTPAISGDEQVRLERQWGTARLSQGLRPNQETWNIDQSPVPLGGGSLVQVVEGDGIALGRDLLGWGDFEDVLADGVERLGQNFVFDHVDKRLRQDGPAEGRAYARLVRDAKKKDTLWLRPVARIALSRHRLYASTGDSVTPLDPAPTYSMLAKVRGTGRGRKWLRADAYHFDDTNPTEDPSSVSLGSLTVPLEGITKHFETREVPLTLPQDSEGRPPNMVMLYVGLEPSAEGESTFDVDDLEWIEWRDASALPAAYGAFDYAKSDKAQGTLTLLRLALGVE